jgi:hypothetical protein
MHTKKYCKKARMGANLSTHDCFLGYTDFRGLEGSQKTGPGSGAATIDSVARQADER